MADSRIAYGLAKKHGIDTTGMSPKQVWDALKEKGISLGKDREAEQERLAQKYGSGAEIEYIDEKTRISFGKSLDDKIKGRISLSDGELETVFEKIAEFYEKPQKGKGDINLKKVLDLNGFAGTPQKVNKKQFADAVMSGTILYRGLNGENAMQYKQQFYDGELYVGIGLGGNGLYFSKDVGEAGIYAQGSNAVVATVMPSNFRIADDRVRKEYRLFADGFKTTSEHSEQEKKRMWKIQKALSYGVYCALRGYDAYLPVISPNKNMVILNRSKLIIGENNEQERFLENN